MLAEDGQVGFNYVQDGLETAKSFLDILQSGLASKDSPLPESNLPTEPTVHSAGRETDTCSQGRSTDQPGAPAIGYVTVQQALTCYSYVLPLLDRVVGALTTCARVGGADVSGGQETRAALHLGLFSLASQPALNNEIVLHLVLRIVHHLRAMIKILVSKCKDVIDAPDQGEPGSRSQSESSGNANAPPVSIAAILCSVSDHVIKKEKMLVEKLSVLTGGL